MQEQFEGREFFKGSDTSFGIFYPTGYIIAVFDSYEIAQRGKEILLSAGYSEDEVDVVPCDYVISDTEKGTTDASFLSRVAQRFSEAVGTEASYWQENLKWAKQGAGFLAVHCPTGPEAKRVQRLLKSENPKSMRRYTRLAIEDLS